MGTAGRPADAGVVGDRVTQVRDVKDSLVWLVCVVPREIRWHGQDCITAVGQASNGRHGQRLDHVRRDKRTFKHRKKTNRLICHVKTWDRLASHHT